MYHHPLLPFSRLFPLLVSCLLLLSASCSSGGVAAPSGGGHTFTVDQLAPHTPPLHQGRTSTCWAYATASLLESEWLAAHPGDTLRLSVMYGVRAKYLRQLEAYYYSQGREEVRNGGLGCSFLHAVGEQGIVPLEAYRGCPPGARRHDHRRLLKQLKKLAASAVKERDLPGLRLRAAALLDREMGAVPDTFCYRGTRYTPRSFADSLGSLLSGYVCLTSFSHHPFHKDFVLEVPDNWEHTSCLNLPLDELEQAVRRALAMGHTVAWHGDVSEPGFRARRGTALFPRHPVTQELRQQLWEQFETTDDHMMHLIGTAHDEQGTLYYILKDSYGSYAPYGGLLYMSADYFRAKTLSVLLRRECLPEAEAILH